MNENPPLTDSDPRVVVETNLGSFVIGLYAQQAPVTVANFLSLIESEFYDGKKFHKLLRAQGNRGFIQAGHPDNGTGRGDVGYTIKDEIVDDLKHERGMVAMAVISWLKDPNDPESELLTKPDTASSQFYICLDDQPQLDGKDTVFGRLITGEQVLDKLTVDSVIRKVTIIRKRNKTYLVEKVE